MPGCRPPPSYHSQLRSCRVVHTRKTRQSKQPRSPFTSRDPACRRPDLTQLHTHVLLHVSPLALDDSSPLRPPRHEPSLNRQRSRIEALTIGQSIKLDLLPIRIDGLPNIERPQHTRDIDNTVSPPQYAVKCITAYRSRTRRPVSQDPRGNETAGTQERPTRTPLSSIL